ncbi:MAG: SprB repeat-containing protein, partial [Flavobacteriales bacterium]
MKKQLLTIALLFLSYFLNAQFITSNDTIICQGEEVTLVASGANITESLVNTDDIHSDAIDIGFDFNFYGNTYNQCVISANGYITFDMAQAGMFSPWTIGAAIPNAGIVPENAIMAPWHDIDPGVDGNIVFGTYGAAPNRVFYVVWCNIPMFSCNNLIAGQYLILRETTNIIEMHIESKPICSTWNGGAAIQGIVNENSTLFEIVDDPALLQPRNFPLEWDANLEGWEFVPNANFDDYTINTIPYNPIATGTVIWTDQFGNVVSNELEFNINPPVGTNQYFITVEDVCTGENIVNVDSVTVQVSPPSNAGIDEDTTVFFCDNFVNQINMNTFLGDDYDFGGSWYFENLLIDSLVDVNESSTGQYTYIVYGLSENCNDTATVNLIVNSLPHAGVEGFKLVCSGDPSFNLFDELNGNPDAGGVWYDENMVQVPEIFDPATSQIGVYTYVVQGLNACPSDSQTVTISYQEGFDIQTYSTPVSCNGYQDGSILLEAENNTVSPITYSIDNGQTFNNFNSFQNLEYGDYNVQVRDGNGCIADTIVTISSAAPEIDVLTTSTDVLCNGDSSGTISVSSIFGGNISSSYNYTWFYSGTDQIVGTDSFLTVPAGGYYLVVEDDNGCIATDEVSVEQPNLINYDINTSHISCLGENDGYISVNVNGGGTAPFTYNWLTNGNSSNPFITSLVAGTYELEINDANACLTNIEIELNEPNLPLTFSIDSINISCFSEATGSATATVNGGTPPYSYYWSSGHVTATANQLFAGDYQLSVSDQRGCIISDSITIIENSEIVLNTSSVSTSCYNYSDGIASVIANGGQGNLTYLWSNGDSSTSITSNFGEYWVKVEDDLGCVVLDTILIDQPNEIKIQLLASDVKCHGGLDGSISSLVLGGTPFNNQTYTYQWSIDGNSFGFNSSTSNNLPFSTSPYQLEVTDANGCISSAITFVNQPAPLKLDTSTLVSAYCTNIATGQASVVVEGGFLNPDNNYSFLWNTGETTPLIQNKTA